MAVISIKTTHKQYQRNYFANVEFDSAEFDTASWNWISPALQAQAKLSELRPIQTQTIRTIQRGLQIAKRIPAWKALVAVPVQEATGPLLIEFLASFDNEMSCLLSLSRPEVARVARVTRQFIKLHAIAHSGDSRLTRVTFQYRSQLQDRHSSRKLISDLPDQKRPIAAAIPHADLKDYDEKLRKILKDDIEKIGSACLSELNRFEMAVAELQRLKKAELPPQVEAVFRIAMMDDVDAYAEPLKLPADQLEYLLIFTIQLASNLREPVVTKRRNDAYKLFRNCQKLRPMMKKRLFGFENSNHIQRIVRMDEGPPMSVLIACALILQIHTNWNFSSVVALKRDALEIKGFPHELQSIKAKTADNTPYAFVERSDEAVIQVCNFLVRRLDLLIEKGLVSKSEQRLWIGSKSIFGKGEPQDVTGWGVALAALCREKGLPHFSLEQMRGQGLALEALGPGGVEAARQKAGHHKSITTLGYFMDSILMRRRNAANSLEFERRFDATIRYMIEPAKVSSTQRLIAYPIGDGTSCSDPKKPPDDAWLGAGVCTATSCHTGSGCANRRLIIDETRIEEVVLLKQFYSENWNRLANENAKSFEAKHQPAMLFNFALYGALKRGPYRHLVSKYEA